MADLNNSLIRVLDKLKVAFGISSILPGSKLYQLAESIAYESYLTESMIDENILKNSLATATGYDLDLIGRNFFGISRIEEITPKITESMKLFKFYTNNGVSFGEINKLNDQPTDILVPEGTLITGVYLGVEYTYRITSNILLTKNTSVGYFGAELIIGDNKTIPANTIKSHNFLTYTTSSSNLLLVTNTASIGTGRDRESDDNYRYRLTTSLKANSSSGYYGIKNKILEIPGVSNVEVLNGGSSGGSCDIYIQGVTPITSDELIITAKNAISSFIPPWCEYSVMKYRTIGLTMSFSIESGGRQLSQSSIDSLESIITDYVNNFYGNEFRILTLSQLASQASPEFIYARLETLQVYSGSGDFRVYEDIDLLQVDPTIYLSNIDKIIIEQVYQPIKIVE